MNVAKPLRLTVLALPALALLTTGCRPVPSLTGTKDLAAEAETVRRIDADWAKAAATHNVDAWMSFYAPNAVVLPPNDKTVDSPATIRPYIAELLGLKDLALDWKATRVTVAQGGDMAWLYGTYTLQAHDPAGVPINDRGKIAEVWQKQTDGTWKCALDTWSSDLPMLQPEPEKK